MRSEKLPISTLPVWAELNNVTSSSIQVAPIVDGKGLGLISSAELLEGNEVLVTVPQDLVLSLERVWVLAKSDTHLREVLESVGEYSRTARGAILIFLILQITQNASSKSNRIGNLNAFSQYVQYLPRNIPLPTFWNTTERALLKGTTLEAAVEAKMKSLDREFTMLEKATLSIGWCETHWWNAETGRLSFDDWKYADAVYRSRALDLPGTGHALVPFIDMANHASGDSTFALYDTDSAENAILVIREGKTCGAGEEITITYGDEKGACEMLFSYGFIEHSMLDARELYLDLEIPDDDPLKLAKKAVSKSPPGVRIFIHDQSIGWESPFVWLLCLNEEDGLDLKVLQNNDGTKELKAFWNRSEIENMCALESILKVEPLWDVFRLRATVILQARVEAQLILFESTKDDHDRTRSFGTGINHDISRNVMRLRELEVTLMLQAYEEFEKQKTSMLESRCVQKYLGSGAAASLNPPDEDFS